MINPRSNPIDVDEMREWANDYRNAFEPPLSWAKFSKESGVPAGTLQPFCKGTYEGNLENIATKLFRFRQAIDSREASQANIPQDPGFFQTETSLRVGDSLQLAHSGRMTLLATGPGTGKTRTAEEYVDSAQPAWLFTMSPSTATLNAMIGEVQDVLKMSLRYGYSSQASRAVMNKVRGMRALMVFDESQHLHFEALEEIRTWHDKTGVGICLMGNDDLLDRIRSGRQSDAFARLNSRLADTHVQKLPTPGDVRAFCDAWQIEDKGMRNYLRKIALTPRSGGLRECRMLIQAGSFLAAGEDRGLTIADLRDVQSRRSTRWIGA